MPAGVTVVGVPMTRDRQGPRQGRWSRTSSPSARCRRPRGIFPKETFLTAVRQALKDKCAMIPLNEQAFEWGVKAASEVLVP